MRGAVVQSEESITPTSKSKISGARRTGYFATNSHAMTTTNDVVPQGEDMQVSCHSELVSESNNMTTLPPHPSPLPQGAREQTRAAFTLAEVLITLGIIGVVAAMTIPTLATKIQHQQTTARLKKFYSTMKQMNISAEEEFGDISSWDITLTYEDYLKTYFVPFLKGSIEVKGGPNEALKTNFIFNDGSYFTLMQGNCMDIRYDTNGYSKPNKEGVDQFRFLMCPSTATGYCEGKGGFCSYREITMTTRQARLDACKEWGGACSALLEYDNWEFAKDYPY